MQGRDEQYAATTHPFPTYKYTIVAVFFGGVLIVAMMMMNKAGAKPSLLCVLLQPTTTYINREK